MTEKSKGFSSIEEYEAASKKAVVMTKIIGSIFGFIFLVMVAGGFIEGLIAGSIIDMLIPIFLLLFVAVGSIVALAMYLNS